MVLFALKPHLMQGFEQFIINFAICREVRSLDAEINLYKIQTIIPQVFTKEYENLAMEEITYQGAYIRTLTMVVLEHLVSTKKESLLKGEEIS